jgi:hypothetical protein
MQKEGMEEIWSISHTFEQVLCAEMGINRFLSSKIAGHKSQLVGWVYFKPEKSAFGDVS